MVTQTAATAPDLAFPRRFRLKKPADVRRVFRQGRRMRKGCVQLTARAAETADAVHRFAVVVGKRHGNAVRRNTIKRILRESIRHNRVHWGTTPPADVVLTPARPLPDIPRPTRRQLRADADETLTKYARSRAGS